MHLKVSAAVQLTGGQPGPIQLLAVEGGILHVLHGTAGRCLDETRRIDDQLPVGEGEPRLAKRRRIDEIETLTRDRKEAKRCPDIPGAQTA